MNKSFCELPVVHGAHAGKEGEYGGQAGTCCTGDRWRHDRHYAWLIDAVREAVLAVDNAVDGALTHLTHRLPAGAAVSGCRTFWMNCAVHDCLLWVGNHVSIEPHSVQSASTACVSS